jgi:hypothetical protein
MFMYRKEAEALVKELGGTVPAAAGAATTPAATPTATTLPVATPPTK